MIRNGIWSGFAVAMLLMFSAMTMAQADDGVPSEVKRILDRIIPEFQPDDIRPAAIDGFFEVSYGADIFYVSSDGRYLLRGDLMDLETQSNLTEARRGTFRSNLMDSLASDEMVIFAPANGTRHVVYVFTDIDCSFCRQFHREINTYTARGIEVRYLAYPRSGPDTPSYYKITTVWCAEDQLDAMTRAKAGENLPRQDCENPVRKQMEIADRVGVRGTPTFVLADGTLLPGYVPADRLADYLDGEFGD